MNKKVIGVTGHVRISHSKDKINTILKPSLITLFNKGYTKVLTGMACGFDQIVAQTCIDLEIPFDAIIPFNDHGSNWSKTKFKNYNYLLSKAKEIITVTSGSYANWKYIKRDEWVVDNSDVILAYLDPAREEGGTYYTVQYGIKKSKPVKNLFILLK